MEPAVQPRGIPGLRGAEHFGFTVPDMEVATQFLVEVLGCELLYSIGPFERDDIWMKRHLNVGPGARMHELRYFRCAWGPHFEVFDYRAAGRTAYPPTNSDIGGHHIALYVDDIDRAVSHLRAHGITILGEPTSSGGPSAGQRWVYFLSPWGMQFELVSFPNGKAIDRGRARFWLPGPSG